MYLFRGSRDIGGSRQLYHRHGHKGSCKGPTFSCSIYIPSLSLTSKSTSRSKVRDSFHIQGARESDIAVGAWPGSES